MECLFLRDSSSDFGKAQELQLIAAWIEAAARVDHVKGLAGGLPALQVVEGVSGQEREPQRSEDFTAKT